MARSSVLSLQRLLLLLVLVLGALVPDRGGVVALAIARPLLGIAEPPAAAPAPASEPQPAGRRPDRSIAGAEVILGGFAAAVMAVIFCYIRVTKKINDRAAAAVGEIKA